MNRFVSILALVSLLCSSLAASVGGQLILCSHEDGQGYLVEFSAHEKQHSDPCHAHQDGYPTDSDNAESHEDALCYFEAQDCEDVEIPQTDLRDKSQSGDRLLVKSPAICLCLFDLLPAEINRQIEAHARIDKGPPQLESESRRFAKTIQIRC